MFGGFYFGEPYFAQGSGQIVVLVPGHMVIGDVTIAARFSGTAAVFARNSGTASVTQSISGQVELSDGEE